MTQVLEKLQQKFLYQWKSTIRRWMLVEGTVRAVHSGGAKGAVAPARKTKCFFSNIVSDFAGLFLVAILVRNLTKTEFAPADKKS